MKAETLAAISEALEEVLEISLGSLARVVRVVLRQRPTLDCVALRAQLYLRWAGAP